MKKIIKLTLVISFLFSLTLLNVPANAKSSASRHLNLGAGKVTPELQATMDALAPGEMATAIVTMRDQADLSKIPGANRAARLEGVIRALQAQADASQRQIQAFLTVSHAQGKVSQFTSFWVFNGLSVTATGEVFQELAARTDVFSITPDEVQIVPASPLALNPPETNLSVINAPALWDLGRYGQGVVVANTDTGVDVTHPDLSAQWRGGTNGWFDPYGEHPTTPTDLDGHGTWTMGVMVGRDAGGTSIGVAPQAQWIAVKIFNDQGSATATAIHQGFQWLLDPDGDPNTADAPHVVNNSWTYAYPGCYLEFELDLHSLRAAGILPVFAAGNGGPDPGTSYSPANNPSAFAVGGTYDSDQIYGYSSRGPSSCGEPTSIFPELVAPAVAIHTTDLLNGYYDASGTSLAAPHVAGGLALLLNAFPNLLAADQEAALINSALDLGPMGPDNAFGYGRLDVFTAYQWLMNAPTPTPTPTPTATPGTSVNLALNKLVMVSSFQDSSHNGGMAVDGDLTTFWKTAKAVGRNKLPSEWITIDLGSSMSIGQVILEWDGNYATSYAIYVSEDSSTWGTVYSTATGDGGKDIIAFGPTSARYVRMESTAWIDSSLRNWLREFEVYTGGGPAPTATPAPTPTATPGGGMTMHVGDLDGSSNPGSRNRWDATVTITVHDASENSVLGATVNGTWSDGASGSGACTTNNDGLCSITKGNVKSNASTVTFTVDSVALSTYSYLATANHDPDGDSDGTTITVLKP